MDKETTTKNGASNAPLDKTLDKIILPSSSIQGRSEALRIILDLDPEEGLDEYINSYLLADTGDYISEWDVEKLDKLFHIGNEYEESPLAKLADAADSYYWENVAKRDEITTLKNLISRLLNEIEYGKINNGPHSAVNILKTYID